jgi:hypothetical protein
LGSIYNRSGDEIAHNACAGDIRRDGATMSESNRDHLADALAGMSGGGRPPESQEGQDIRVIGPGAVVPMQSIVAGGATGIVHSVPGKDPLRMQRTLIPPMLTLGVLFPLLALGQWIDNPDDPFSAKSMPGIAAALAVVGLLSLALALANVLSVRKKLQGTGRVAG